MRRGVPHPAGKPSRGLRIDRRLRNRAQRNRHKTGELGYSFGKSGYIRGRRYDDETLSIAFRSRHSVRKYSGDAPDQYGEVASIVDGFLALRITFGTLRW